MGLYGRLSALFYGRSFHGLIKIRKRNFGIKINAVFPKKLMLILAKKL